MGVRPGGRCGRWRGAGCGVHVPRHDEINEITAKAILQASTGGPLSRIIAQATRAGQWWAVEFEGPVARLRAEGLTDRDIGTLMGLSPQRVSQLAS